MAVILPGLPANFRAPGTYIANVPRGSGATVGPEPTLIIGQMLSTGSAVHDVPVQVFSQGDVDALAGAGSMLSQMFRAYALNDVTGPYFILPLQDNAAGTQASVVATVTGAASAVGTIYLYVNNRLIGTAVSVGDSATTVGNNLATAINAVVNPLLGVTATATGGVVTLVSVHKGITAGDLQVSVNKNGAANGEFLPAGIAIAVAAETAGTADPDLTVALANAAAMPLTVIVCPYTTSTANAQIAAWLSDTVGRWAPTSQVYGVSCNAVRGSLSATATYGATVAADKHVTTLGILDSQTPAYVAAAIFGGLVASTTRAAPQLPIVGVLVGLDAPSRISRLTRAQENTLLYSGISVIRVNGSGAPTLARAVQNYQADANYLNIETDFLVAYVDTYLRSDLEARYAQAALVNDGSPAAGASGSLITSPSLILAHVWGLYLDLEQAAIVQNSKQFINQSYVEADIIAGTVSLYLPVQTAGQLRIIRILNAFS